MLVAQFVTSSPIVGENDEVVRHLIYPSSLEPQIDRAKTRLHRMILRHETEPATN